MNPIPHLPFYEVLDVLIKPTPLVNHGQFSAQQALLHFSLSSVQKDKILESRHVVHSTDENGAPTTTMQCSTQVQLRFWTSQTLSERQVDLLPAELLVEVNNERIHPPPPSIPGIRHKRSSSHALDITTSAMFFASNYITIKWFAEPEYNFVFSVNLVRKLTTQELLSELMTKPMKPSCDTQKMIKKLTSMTSEDPDLCCPKSLKISLTCPVGKSRMNYPCRGVNCKHLQCFDANSFLMMNEKKTTFLCPVCSVKLKLSELNVDGYFMDVIKKLSNKQDCNDVELFADGSWFPVGGKSSTSQHSQKKSPSDKIIVINLEDEDDENEVFIINQIGGLGPSPAFEASFGVFASGIQRSSSRRNSVCGENSQVNKPSLAFESSFAAFAGGVQSSSSRRNSSCGEGEITQVIHLPELLNEPDVIDILD